MGIIIIPGMGIIISGMGIIIPGMRINREWG